MGSVITTWQQHCGIQVAANASATSRARATALAEEFGLPIHTLDTGMAAPRLLLVINNNGELGIQLDQMQPLSLQVTTPAERARLLKASGKQEALAKALSLKPGMRILDATAGTGRDSLLLAAIGAQVTLCERHPILQALLADALTALQHDPQLAPIARRCKLYPGSSTDKAWLHQTLPEIDAIYIDPMFPAKQNKAQVKKLAQVLRALASDDTDQASQAETLLAAAQQHRCQRVVIKRPRISDSLTISAPDQQLTGRSTRFDIYYTRK